MELSKMKAEAVVWDWNGTLLNDLMVSIRAMNLMLQKRGYDLLEPGRYRSIFTFPVREYYRMAGVDFDEHDWDAVAMEFIDNYRAGVREAVLHDGASDVISYLKNKGYRQFILSAMQQHFLEETVGERLNIDFFEKVMGLNDHYAATKAGNARMLVDELKIDADRLVMIGDTLHDFEVARDAGMRCILVANGHQSRERLETSGMMVVDRLTELMELF
ncbi:MAG: HAD family hydrolase [Bacteroidales bacterium]